MHKYLIRNRSTLLKTYKIQKLKLYIASTHSGNQPNHTMSNKGVPPLVCFCLYCLHICGGSNNLPSRASLTLIIARHKRSGPFFWVKIRHIQPLTLTVHMEPLWAMVATSLKLIKLLYLDIWVVWYKSLVNILAISSH